MKTSNTILIFAMFLVQFSLFGQKQEANNLTLEMELTPLGSEPLKITSLRARYFTSDKVAYRLGVFLGGNRNPSTSISGETELESVNSSFDLILRPGIEKHFEGTKHLSPYIGGELYLGLGMSTSKSETLWGVNEIMTTTNKTREGSFGLNLLSGADFYITSKVYLGIEMGFGFLREGRGKSSTNYDNPDDPAKENTNEKGNSSSFNWGPNYQGSIRLGYHLK